MTKCGLCSWIYSTKSSNGWYVKVSDCVNGPAATTICIGPETKVHCNNAILQDTDDKKPTAQTVLYPYNNVQPWLMIQNQYSGCLPQTALVCTLNAPCFWRHSFDVWRWNYDLRSATFLHQSRVLLRYMKVDMGISNLWLHYNVKTNSQSEIWNTLSVKFITYAS